MAFEFQPLSELTPEDNLLMLNSLNNNFPGFWAGPPMEEPMSLQPLYVTEELPHDLSPTITEGDPTTAPPISEIGRSLSPTREHRRKRDPQSSKETANQRSRTYRQRKKQAIEEMVRKVNELTLENQKLKNENTEIREAAQRLMEENMTQRQEIEDLTSSSTAASADAARKAIEDTMSSLNAAVSRNQDDDQINSLLEQLHDQHRRAQILKSQEFVEIMSPKIQAKLVILDKTPEYIPKFDYCHSTWTRYLADAGVSEQQIESIRVTRQGYLDGLRTLLTEREQLRNGIKEFYIQNINECSVDPAPILSDGQTVLDLSHQLNRLRTNLDSELKLQETSSCSLSRILTPKQFAILTLKQHEFRQHHRNSMEMLNNIWAAVATHGSRVPQLP